MTNFKKETLNILKENHLTWKDVEFIQTKDFCIKDKDKFLEQMDFDYDNGFGGTEIQEDLVIVGKDWWLERHEYDGSEWWEFKRLPMKNSEICNARIRDGLLYKELVPLKEFESQPVKESWCQDCPFKGLDTEKGITRDVCAVLYRLGKPAILGFEEDRKKVCPTGGLHHVK